MSGGDLVVHVDVKAAITSRTAPPRAIAPTLARSRSPTALRPDIDATAWPMSRAARSARGTSTSDTRSARSTMRTSSCSSATRPDRWTCLRRVESGAVVGPPQVHSLATATRTAQQRHLAAVTIKRTESQAPTTDVDVNAAHDGAGHTYDLYATLWNRDGIDNAGMNMISTVHYSSNYCNAFWNNTQMAYGDGNASQNCGPLARSIDVAAHEMTHGVTSRESNLTYSGESGGLNDSLSDVWGGGFEAWGRRWQGHHLSDPVPLAADVFLIGDTVLPPFLRSMCDRRGQLVARPLVVETSAASTSTTLGSEQPRVLPALEGRHAPPRREHDHGSPRSAWRRRPPDVQGERRPPDVALELRGEAHRDGHGPQQLGFDTATQTRSPARTPRSSSARRRRLRAAAPPRPRRPRACSRTAPFTGISDSAVAT